MSHYLSSPFPHSCPLSAILVQKSHPSHAHYHYHFVTRIVHWAFVTPFVGGSFLVVCLLFRNHQRRLIASSVSCLAGVLCRWTTHFSRKLSLRMLSSWRLRQSSWSGLVVKIWLRWLQTNHSFGLVTVKRFRMSVGVVRRSYAGERHHLSCHSFRCPQSISYRVRDWYGLPILAS
jgi:hypothetical protein